MNTAASSGYCIKADCRVSIDNNCWDGLIPPQSCPNFRVGPRPASLPPNGSTETTTAQVAQDAETNSEPELISTNFTYADLPSGEALVVAEADEVLRAAPARIVAIVGEKDSGKTTLVSSLYSQFLRGAFASYSFKESRTLIGFEKIAHLSRIASGLATSDTKRTSHQEGLMFFHICVLDSSNASHHMLISDRAGEVYREARSDSSLVKDLLEISKCSTLCILVDGRKLVAPLERDEVLFSARQVLRALRDGDGISANTEVQVVFTKFDLISGSINADETIELIDDFEGEIARDFTDSFNALTFHRVTARHNQNGTIDFAGIDDLFKSWLATKVMPSLSFPIKNEYRSERDALLSKWKSDE